MIKVYTLPEFDKNLLRLCKKYRSLKNEYLEFVDLTEKNGVQGEKLGKGIYKARLAVESKGKGKRGGLRIISYSEMIFSFEDESVILVEIYDKSEFSTVSIKRIEAKIKEYIDKL